MGSNVFHGDRPIGSQDQDRFGFGPLAERIAEALTAQAAGKGFVLGIEGRWGSGKSSLLALTLDRLRDMPNDRVAAVEFRPWLIGDRDQLLTALFGDIAKAISSLEQPGHSGNAAADVVKKVKNFASQLGPLGKLAGVAGVFVPGASIAGDLLEKMAAAAAERTEGPTLAEQKEELSTSLLEFNCRIIVAIDDVDRLEPKEVAELLRLVRSVADFPNVSYLLCYDARTLGQAIETATGVSNGTAYLEKIVQTEVGVPQPETFALRRWFSKELQTFAQCAEQRIPYLQHVIDETGGRALENPRSVVRVLDSLRVYWPSLKEKIDLADLVWLRMIAVASPNFYRWVEEYLVAYASLAAGRVHISESERAAVAKRMDEALKRDGLDWGTQQFEIERHLPGISTNSFNQGKDERLFLRSQELSYFKDMQDKRLASPSHSRLYFTLIEPPSAVTNLDIAELIAAAGKGADFAASILTHMHTMKGDAGSSKAEKLLDQLRYIDLDLIQSWPVENIALGLVNAAENLSADRRDDDWGSPRAWYLIKELLEHLRKSLPNDRWDRIVENLFSSGTSIAFLSYVLRNETFGHGFYGDRPNRNECLTSPETFEIIRRVMLARYASGGIDAILKEHSASTMLYAWSQAGGYEYIIGQIKTKENNDVWLIEFVKILLNKSIGTDGARDKLSFEALQNFFEFPSAVARRILAIAVADPPTRGATEIIKAIEANSQSVGGKINDIVRSWEEVERSRQQNGKPTATS